jgi:hypothetical protein
MVQDGAKGRAFEHHSNKTSPIGDTSPTYQGGGQAATHDPETAPPLPDDELNKVITRCAADLRLLIEQYQDRGDDDDAWTVFQDKIETELRLLVAISDGDSSQIERLGKLDDL